MLFSGTLIPQLAAKQDIAEYTMTLHCARRMCFLSKERMARKEVHLSVLFICL